MNLYMLNIEDKLINFYKKYLQNINNIEMENDFFLKKEELENQIKNINTYGKIQN